ncbi:IS66 family transposase [Hoeflea sp.]|uniref:IS66 family transposase n=1 Tax=Hoeflea sp. TaxID=1940281 RepID=UPI003B01CC9E
MQQTRLTRDRLSALSKPDLIDLVMELAAQNALLQARVDELEKQNRQLRDQNASLVQRVSDLERRLGLNSSNSSKPPSSDGLAKPAARERRTRSLRGKSGRKSGGQHGHKGTTLKQVATPDALVHHYPHQCTRCSATLSSEAATGFAARQVFGLAPPPPLFITEHRAHTCRCRSCGTLVRAAFPETVKAPAQYGDEIAALAAYLQTQHCIPEDRLARIFSDLYKIRVAPATLASLIAKKADSMRIFADRVRELLCGTAVAVKHLDETGLRIAGKTRWLHMLCSTSLSHLRLGTGRGDIPSGLAGTIVHDCWPPYLALEAVEHGLCNAHLLRELQAVIDHDREPWATDMKALLSDARTLAQMARDQGRPAVSLRHVRQIRQRFDACCDRAIKFHEGLPPLARPTTGKRGRPKRRAGHNLARRMRTHKAAVLLFFNDLNVPFTNNEAERDLRMTKVRQKVSGSFRTETGAENYCILRTVVETARKQSWDVLRALSKSPVQLIRDLNTFHQIQLDRVAG